MTTKVVRLSGHALSQLVRRGVSETEVAAAVRGAPWQPAELGRLECRYDVPFDGLWNGRYYRTKQIRPIFVDEPDEVVVVTVYTHYF
jgi:hypothetical protein